jgi:hypothetical protein
LSDQDSKELKIHLNNGTVLRIPKIEIEKITLPGLVIRRDYFRLVLSMQNYQQQLAQIKRRFSI